MGTANLLKLPGAWPGELRAEALAKAAPKLARHPECKPLLNALLKAEAAAKRVDPTVFDFKPSSAQTPTLAEVEAAEKRARIHHKTQVQPLSDALQQIKEQSTRVAKWMGGQPEFTRTDAATLVGLLRSSSDWIETIRDPAPLFLSFDAMRKDVLRDASQLRSRMMPLLQSLQKGLDQCQRSPSRETWDKACRAPCKAVHTAIKTSPRLHAALWPDWKMHDGDSFSHALQVAEKAAKDAKGQSKLQEVILRMCKDLKTQIAGVENELR